MANYLRYLKVLNEQGNSETRILQSWDKKLKRWINVPCESISYKEFYSKDKPEEIKDGKL